MRSAISFIAAMVVACSDASQGSKDPNDAATANDASSSDAVAAIDDASDDAVTSADALPSQGGCAACTANQCLSELQACGGSQDCLNNLVDFNTCLSTSAGDCGTKLAAGGSLESSLWSCLASKCTSTCGAQ